jgi:hypothetical protein
MTVKDNLIAAKALIADEVVYDNANRTTGSGLGWALDEACGGRNEEAAAMFKAISPFWEVGPHKPHSMVMDILDRAIAAQEA